MELIVVVEEAGIDFRNSLIQFTKVDLNWFFDQWLETNKRIDYSVKVKDNLITFCYLKFYCKKVAIRRIPQ